MVCYSSSIQRTSPVDAWLTEARQDTITANDMAKKASASLSTDYPGSMNSSRASFSTSSSLSNATIESHGPKLTTKQGDAKFTQPHESTNDQALCSSAASTAGSRKSHNTHHRADTASLKEYGECYRRLGEGTTAVVMVVRQLGDDGRSEKLYAIKQFRKRQKQESDKDYMKKLTSEFCISSTFSHPNVVDTIDLVLDERKRYCTVMEYCPGGDLFSAIMAERMTERDKACAFKQMMQGIAYLHSVGVAHRDIKPENLLLTATGQLKITDFGVSDVFRFAWEAKGHKTRGLVGSEPYIAPEAFDQKEFWGANADVWSAGIVLYCLWFGGLAWHRAKKSDSAYASYKRIYPKQSYELFRSLQPPAARSLLYKMLDPNPDTRITAAEVLNEPWMKSIKVCHRGVDDDGHSHCHTARPVKR